ncbi:MAG: ribonuclease III [Flavobacteriaceae bacterium]
MNILQKILKNSRAEKGGSFFKKIYQITGFKPKNIEIYQRAFTHSSVNKTDENGQIINYERLEFLGDAMLGSVIAAYLFREVPNQNEGYLTKMRAKIVSRENLNNLGKQLGLIELITSKVSQKHFGENIYGNLFEALVGAIYLDRGYLTCEKFINKKLITPYVNIERLEGKIISYKSLLIEWCQKHKKHFAIRVEEEKSAEVQKHFSAQLFIDDKVVSKARATSKKKAEETASKRAYFAFQKEILKS